MSVNTFGSAGIFFGRFRGVLQGEVCSNSRISHRTPLVATSTLTIQCRWVPLKYIRLTFRLHMWESRIHLKVIADQMKRFLLRFVTSKTIPFLSMTLFFANTLLLRPLSKGFFFSGPCSPLGSPFPSGKSRASARKCSNAADQQFTWDGAAVRKSDGRCLQWDPTGAGRG